MATSRGAPRASWACGERLAALSFYRAWPTRLRPGCRVRSRPFLVFACEPLTTPPSPVTSQHVQTRTRTATASRTKTKTKTKTKVRHSATADARVASLASPGLYTAVDAPPTSPPPPSLPRNPARPLLLLLALPERACRPRPPASARSWCSRRASTPSTCEATAPSCQRSKANPPHT